jgi:hypothetical protein
MAGRNGTISTPPPGLDDTMHAERIKTEETATNNLLFMIPPDFLLVENAPVSAGPKGSPALGRSIGDGAFVGPKYKYLIVNYLNIINRHNAAGDSIKLKHPIFQFEYFPFRTARIRAAQPAPSTPNHLPGSPLFRSD